MNSHVGTAGLVATAALGMMVSLPAQESTRQIWDSGFRQKRPPAVTPADDRKADPPIDYRVSGGSPPAPTATTRLVGFTVWRLRKAAAADTAPRLLVQDSPTTGSVEYVADRVPPGEALAVGDRIRIGIEVPQRGFLYIIDRERYSDGSRGAPHLIFPARNLQGGDNRVEPGRLIEIPAQGDPVPALRVARETARHIGEELMVLVTTTPIAGVTAGERELRLPEEVVARWERQWAGQRAVTRLDLAAGSPTTSWTAVERGAGLAERLLTQGDPMPASLYHTEIKEGALVVHIPLTVK